MKLPNPTLQIEFATLLEGARTLVLREALRKTLKRLDISAVDSELAGTVSKAALSTLASHGLRGEVLFPTPIVLRAQPTLIGYYRLLYGYSQKQFYARAAGCGLFKLMEAKGILRPAADKKLDALCHAFAEAGASLLTGVEDHLRDDSLFHELSLLTLGSQYRGGANNKRGAAGIKAVFEVIRGIVEDAIVTAGDVAIEVENAAKRRISIVLAPDPDILIKSYSGSSKPRTIVAIEVKAGEDQSNIHNRIGEAEKSHQKAKAQGINDCWTIINVPQADMEKLSRESPTTNRFFQLLDLTNPDSAPYADFRETVRDLVGLKS